MDVIPAGTLSQDSVALEELQRRGTLESRFEEMERESRQMHGRFCEMLQEFYENSKDNCLSIFCKISRNFMKTLEAKLGVHEGIG